MTLGRLEAVSLRQIWTHEARSFTTWLAEEENLKLLSETIGIDLEVQATEQAVGPFRADMLCKAVGNADHWVLVENQIEQTDHPHLGQIITYAAGLQTATIIWIARQFTEQHRAALDWLNEITKEEISFFGLEVQLWRIGNSPPAPKFNVISRPNEFVKVTKTASSSNSYRELYLEYWTAFSEFLRTNSTVLKSLKPSADYWQDLATIAPNIRLRAMAGARDKFNMVDLVFYKDADKAKIGYLMQFREEIDKAIPGLIWRPKDGYKESAVELHLRGADPSQREDWPRQHLWLCEQLTNFHRTFSPLVRSLP
ncbi:MAG TPA: DUF4268 domain-containing protein [Fimbriimonadaceae bacterium]|jgi:hypothetical protein